MPKKFRKKFWFCITWWTDIVFFWERENCHYQTGNRCPVRQKGENRCWQILFVCRQHLPAGSKTLEEALQNKWTPLPGEAFQPGKMRRHFLLGEAPPAIYPLCRSPFLIFISFGRRVLESKLFSLSTTCSCTLKGFFCECITTFCVRSCVSRYVCI